MPASPPSDEQELEPVCTPPPAPEKPPERATTVWSPSVITGYDATAPEDPPEE